MSNYRPNPSGSERALAGALNDLQLREAQQANIKDIIFIQAADIRDVLKDLNLELTPRP